MSTDRSPSQLQPTAKPQPKPKAKPQAKVKPASVAEAPTPLEVVKPLVRVRQMREFTGKRVTKAELVAITEVARWSGSSRNEQPCRFITLRDKDVIGKIAELGLPQTRGLRVGQRRGRHRRAGRAGARPLASLRRRPGR